MSLLLTLMILFIPSIFIGIALWYLLAPVPGGTLQTPRNECPCPDCMEPTLR
jgi:hypothetical protein